MTFFALRWEKGGFLFALARNGEKGENSDLPLLFSSDASIPALAKKGKKGRERKEERRRRTPNGLNVLKDLGSEKRKVDHEKDREFFGTSSSSLSLSLHEF